MYKIHKTLVFTLLIIILGSVTGCKSCDNPNDRQEEKTNPNRSTYGHNSTKPSTGSAEDKHKGPTSTFAEAEPQKPNSSSFKEDDNMHSTTDDNIEDETIISLKIKIKKLENEIKATTTIVDSKLQKLTTSPEIPIDIQEKIQQALKNKQEKEKQQHESYGEQQADLLYREIMRLVEDIVSQNLSLSKDLKLILSSLQVDLKSIKELGVEEYEIKLERDIKVISNDIDNNLHKLVKVVNLPADMRKNIQQELQKQQDGMASRIEIYADIEGLLKGIDLENMKLSESETYLIERFLKGLGTLRSLERNKPRVKELEKELEKEKK